MNQPVSTSVRLGLTLLSASIALLVGVACSARSVDGRDETVASTASAYSGTIKCPDGKPYSPAPNGGTYGCRYDVTETTPGTISVYATNFSNGSDYNWKEFD